jgi:hypothetical protein
MDRLGNILANSMQLGNITREFFGGPWLGVDLGYNVSGKAIGAKF